MINTSDDILFLQSGEALDKTVRMALRDTGNALLEAYGLTDGDLETVTTRTKPNGAFAAFIRFCTLKFQGRFDESYVLNAQVAFDEGAHYMSRQAFERFTLCHQYPHGRFEFKRTFAVYVRCGIGLFLVSMHAKRALVLPATFKWPTSRAAVSSTDAASKLICRESELLSFIRGIETRSGATLDPILASVGRDKKRLQWFTTYVTKLVLAGGWHRPEDIRHDDVIDLRARDWPTDVTRAFLDVIRLKYGERCPIRAEDWPMLLQSTRHKRQFKSERLSGDIASAEIANGASATIFEITLKRRPSEASPKRLASLKGLPGIDFDVSKESSQWIRLQEVYFKEYKREDYKQTALSLNTLNLYLFYYLPYWFAENRDTKLEFPNMPDKLIGSVFISRLMRPDMPVPMTLMDFMQGREKNRNQTAETSYGYIKQIETFFNFLVTHADELPNCRSFKQSIKPADYPRLAKSLGTNKSPIPRRLFKPLLAYIEAALAYVNALNEMVFLGQLKPKDVGKIVGRFIDTKSVEEKYGLSQPHFDFKDTRIQIDFFPWVTTADWYQTKEGLSGRVFRPHALIQILVALYTGLRQNHIQWLDAEDFDRLVTDDSSEYCKLVVNTDKAKKKAWAPTVNKRVIELLRSQYDWRSRIAEPAFGVKHYYNNNDKTSYPKFYPLFAYDPRTGLPHGDSVYDVVWQNLLSGFQASVICALGEEALGTVLCRLKAPNVDFDDLNEKQKLQAYATHSTVLVKSVGHLPSCPLTVKTLITPHSCRVTVVSHLIQFLSADLIGKNITGQTEATVNHYVRIEPEDIERHQVVQARALQQKAYENQVTGFLNNDPKSNKPFIKADDVNSALAKSMRQHVSESIVRFGCISIDYVEDGEGGLDILKQKGLNQAAFNKTEICPYGNNCPQDVVKNLKGLRRCSLCPYAVRSIDHLPALIARAKCTAEQMAAMDDRIAEGNSSYTDAELDALEEERQRLGEELAGWQLCSEALEHQRVRILAGEEGRQWLVEQPEIIAQDLQRIEVPTDATAYLISRLQEALQYPGFQSEKIKHQFNALRRRILISSPDTIYEALSMHEPINPAAECAGAIKSLVQAHKLTVDDVHNLLTTDIHLKELPVNRGALRFLGHVETVGETE